MCKVSICDRKAKNVIYDAMSEVHVETSRRYPKTIKNISHNSTDGQRRIKDTFLFVLISAWIYVYVYGTAWYQ